MIAVLVTLRDFFVTVLISWLGVAAEPADTQKQSDSVAPATAKIALLQ